MFSILSTWRFVIYTSFLIVAGEVVGFCSVVFVGSLGIEYDQHLIYIILTESIAILVLKVVVFYFFFYRCRYFPEFQAIAMIGLIHLLSFFIGVVEAPIVVQLKSLVLALVAMYLALKLAERRQCSRKTCTRSE